MRQNKLFLFLLSVLFSVGAMAQTATSLLIPQALRTLLTMLLGGSPMPRSTNGV